VGEWQIFHNVACNLSPVVAMPDMTVIGGSTALGGTEELLPSSREDEDAVSTQGPAMGLEASLL